MIGMRNVLIIIALFTAAHVSCEDQFNPDIRVLPDAVWNVMYTSFAGKNLSQENEHLVKSVPLLLKAELDSIRVHYFDQAAVADYQKELVYEKLKIQFGLLKQSQKDRDAIAFKVMDVSEKEKKLKDLDLAIAKVMDTISQYQKYDYSQIEFPRSMAIKVMDNGNQALFDAPKFSPLQYAIDKKTNLLIFGTIEEIQGYLVVDVRALDSIREKEVFSFSKALNPQELQTIVDETKNGLASSILGSDWGSIAITIEPSNGIIFMDDVFLGIGNTKAEFIDPGEKKIRVQAPGFYTKEKTISIVPGNETDISMNLAKEEVAKMHIDSDPEGASVYINSEWAGKTPIDIEKTKEMKRVLLKFEGYDDYSFHIDEKSGSSEMVSLKKHTIDFNAKQADMRNNFYTSFGLLLVSIALPVFVSAFGTDYENALQSMNPSDPAYNNYLLSSQILSASFWGALAITGVLVGTTIYNLVLYIIASDRPFG
jgi:hypothetical protein